MGLFMSDQTNVVTHEKYNRDILKNFFVKLGPVQRRCVASYVARIWRHKKELKKLRLIFAKLTSSVNICSIRLVNFYKADFLKLFKMLIIFGGW